jgi:nucleotide-binding universal stress UspA family protein
MHGRYKMVKINKILFPVDLSEMSQKIVPYIVTMAEKFNTDIHLLFVVNNIEHFPGFHVPNTMIYNLQMEITEKAEKKLHEFENEYFKNFPNTKAVVELGNIAEEIKKYAEDTKIDLIIMGTHGRKGLEKVFFGSVADRVIKSVHIPVLLVNPNKESNLS